MVLADGQGPRVAWVGAHLDSAGRGADALLAGGWPDFGRNAAGACRAGARVTMVQASWEDAEREIDGVLCHFVREQGDPFIRLPGGQTVRRRPRRLLERVAALAPELIHFEGLLFPRVVRALATALPGVPTLAQDHFTKCPRGWRRRWYRWGFARLAGVAFTARSQAAPFLSAGVLRPNIPIFEVIEVSSAFTPGDQQAARAATGLDGDPCVLSVANLNARKDPITVLNAVARVANEFPGLRLHMCFRDTALLDAVQARIAGDPALADRVRLIGDVPHRRIEMHFRAADFLIQASHMESTGVVAIEALSCGTTPLVTDIPSFRRITGHGAFGALIPVGDAAALADAIRDWCRRDRPTLRRRAREHFERELSFDAIGGQLREAYEALRVTR
jgi:glycosyltransferase involved in cell wall biosynthesis